MTTLDPWGAVKIDNYSKLFDEFGISKFDDLFARIPNPHRYMRRHVIFGHRSYESVLEAMLAGKPFAAMSGFMPSGRAHLGHKMVMEEIIWHQQQGGDAFLAIADMEAHAVRGKSWKECRELGINEYILSAMALGFEPGERGHIYFQSKSANVKDLSFELGIKANFSELSAIYGFNGETNIAHMVSAVTQSADILQPQLAEFGGPKPVVIPVGADQDPHIRLTRGLADKMNKFHVFPGPPRNPNFKGMINIYLKSPNEKYLFSWDEIPENDNGRLIKFLTQKFGINWVKLANIEKIDNGRTIRITAGINFISLRLNNEKTKVNLEIDDGRIAEFPVNLKNGKLNIYDNIYDTNKTEHEFSILKNRLLQEKIVAKEGIKFDDTEDSLNRYTGHIEIACIKSSREDLLPKVQRLVMKVANELGGYAFMPPASTYHKFMTGLQGGKMSSSIPESYIALTEKPEEGAKKVMRAKTGGRVTLEEQKKLGGEPDKCTAYELLLYHLVEDDNKLLEIYKDCVGGTRVCGNCKKHAAELMRDFLKGHQEKRELARERLGEFGL